MIGQVLYAKHPDRLANFYGSLFQMDRSEMDSASFTLVGPDFEIHIVQIPEDIARTFTLSTPPAPRENTPLKFSVEVSSVDHVAKMAQALGGEPRGESWEWHARRHLDIVDLEGSIFQVFERIP